MNAIEEDQRPVWERLAVGQEIPPLVRGPLTPVHLMRWSAAIENWHRIHYDHPFATQHDGLPCLLVNGSWKQHFLTHMMTNWLAPSGWLARIELQFREIDTVGSTLTAWGTVKELYVRDGLGYVVCDVGIRNHEGRESTPGTAIGVLPRRGGKSVPYPFPDQEGACQ